MPSNKDYHDEDAIQISPKKDETIIDNEEKPIETAHKIESDKIFEITKKQEQQVEKYNEIFFPLINDASDYKLTYLQIAALQLWGLMDEDMNLISYVKQLNPNGNQTLEDILSRNTRFGNKIKKNIINESDLINSFGDDDHVIAIGLSDDNTIGFFSKGQIMVYMKKNGWMSDGYYDYDPKVYKSSHKKPELFKTIVSDGQYRLIFDKYPVSKRKQMKIVNLAAGGTISRAIGIGIVKPSFYLGSAITGAVGAVGLFVGGCLYYAVKGIEAIVDVIPTTIIHISAGIGAASLFFFIKGSAGPLDGGKRKTKSKKTKSKKTKSKKTKSKKTKSRK